ncbi:hypothetical protein ACSX1A_05865 [Pontibacter sp. MBLB2868]|uniref:hypothetical protein n=1 Tax=Pontibacter sp. MBLB2868 TaxID=3451555 RepID=UPI003F755394
MKCTGSQQHVRKIYTLLAVLLSCVFALSVPVSVEAAVLAAVSHQEDLSATSPAQSVLIAGEVSGNTAAAVLQLDKAVLLPCLHTLLAALYPTSSSTEGDICPFPGSKGDSGLRIPLSKGP